MIPDPHKWYRFKFIATSREEDFKHNLIIHKALDFYPTLRNIKEQDLKWQAKVGQDN